MIDQKIRRVRRWFGGLPRREKWLVGLIVVMTAGLVVGVVALVVS